VLQLLKIKLRKKQAKKFGDRFACLKGCIIA